jgi:cell division protein FtsL
VLGSALAVVDAEYRSRALFVSLEQLRKERDRLDLEWRNLRLEMSTWANQGQVEKLARERLGMRCRHPWMWW